MLFSGRSYASKSYIDFDILTLSRYFGTRHNVCRALSKILIVNFDQLQIPRNEQRNMNTVGNNLNSA